MSEMTLLKMTSLDLRRCNDMNVPLLGPMTLTGFAHTWWFLFLSWFWCLWACTSPHRLPASAGYCGSPIWSCWKALHRNVRTAGGMFPQLCWWHPFFCSPSRWPDPRVMFASRATAPW